MTPISPGPESGTDQHADLKTLLDELKLDFNRHLRMCPHGKAPVDCTEPECVARSVLES